MSCQTQWQNRRVKFEGWATLFSTTLFVQNEGPYRFEFKNMIQDIQTKFYKTYKIYLLWIILSFIIHNTPSRNKPEQNLENADIDTVQIRYRSRSDDGFLLAQKNAMNRKMANHHIPDALVCQKGGPVGGRGFVAIGRWKVLLFSAHFGG